MSADIGKSVTDRLLSRAAVTKLVGASVCRDVLDQTIEPPAIVVQVTANSPEEDLGGTNRIYASTVVVLAYGKDRDNANEIALQVRDDALPPNLRGRVEGMDWQEVSLIAGPNEMVEEPKDASDNWRRITSQEFVIWNSAV